MRWLFAFWLAFVATGCATELDDKVARVDDQWHQNGKIMVAAGQSFAKSANAAEDSRHILRKDQIDARLKAFIVEHTGPDGRLTNGTTTRPGDVQKPLLAADLIALIQDRDRMIAQAEAEHRAWIADHLTPYLSMLEKFAADNDFMFDSKADILEKRKRAATFANNAMNTLIGVGSTAGLLIPFMM